MCSYCLINGRKACLKDVYLSLMGLYVLVLWWAEVCTDCSTSLKGWKQDMSQPQGHESYVRTVRVNTEWHLGALYPSVYHGVIWNSDWDLLARPVVKARVKSVLLGHICGLFREDASVQPGKAGRTLTVKCCITEVLQQGRGTGVCVLCGSVVPTHKFDRITCKYYADVLS